jgi:hypothetical protein
MSTGIQAAIEQEEDVLAALVLNRLSYDGLFHDVPELDWHVPMDIGWLAWGRTFNGGDPRTNATATAAITDSEHRLDVLRAEARALEAALLWYRSGGLPPVDVAGPLNALVRVRGDR